jgi:hypothetical protein
MHKSYAHTKTRTLTNPNNVQGAYTHLLSRIVARTVLDGIVYCAYVICMCVRVHLFGECGVVLQNRTC